MASFCSSNDKRNFQWVTVASVDLIKLPLIDILASYIKPVDLFLKIKSCSTLKLRPDQRKICLIQPPGIPDYNTFDVTLLYTLIRNLLVCCLPCPAQGWGNEPKTTDIEISDDIERLRLFRNNYYAHAKSASVPDIEFENVWRNLKLAIKRIACNSNIICNIDYEKDLREIERSKCTEYQLETCRILLEAHAGLQKQTDSKDEPDISIIGEDEKKCGETAIFEANVEMVKSLNWTITWYKRREEVIKCIDTSTEKYRGSTKRRLVINDVCKEDEGEYQAVLSFESNGPDYKSKNTIRLFVFGGPPNIMTNLETNIKNRSVKLIGSIYFYEDSPDILETFWTKNGKELDMEKSGGKLSKTSNDTPSLTIRKVSPDDAGDYRLTARNAVGSSTSDVIVLGIPSVFLEKIEDVENEGQRITVKIKSLPAPFYVQWSAKSKNDENFRPIDLNTKEYEGTTISFPHPVLVVRQKDQLEKNCFRIEVKNFIGNTVHEISGENNPVVLRSTDNAETTPYNDHGANVRFIKLNSILADQFPPDKVKKLKFLLKTSNKVKNQKAVLEAESAMDCLMILQDEKLFTERDVIYMQFLCRETDCLELYAKCIEYADKQKALCFFEKRSVNGYVDVQFHVQGDTADYTKEFIKKVIDTVAAILDCKEEDVLLNGLRNSTSFFLSLSIKNVHIKKLLAMKEQERLKLRKLNIDYLKIDKDTIHLNRKEGLPINDFGNITSGVRSYLTWPLSVFSQQIEQLILCSFFGWTAFWILVILGGANIVYVFADLASVFQLYSSIANFNWFLSFLTPQKADCILGAVIGWFAGWSLFHLGKIPLIYPVVAVFVFVVSIVMMVICIDKTLLRIIDMIGSTILWNILDTIWNFLIILIGILIMSGCDGWGPILIPLLFREPFYYFAPVTVAILVLTSNMYNVRNSRQREVSRQFAYPQDQASQEELTIRMENVHMPPPQKTGLTNATQSKPIEDENRSVGQQHPTAPPPFKLVPVRTEQEQPPPPDAKPVGPGHLKPILDQIDRQGLQSVDDHAAQSGFLVMDFNNITSTVWSYITWPLSFISQPIKQPILGGVFGWAVVWILFHVGYTVLMYIAVLFILSLGAEKFGIVTITIHWKRISELMRSTGAKDSTDGKVPGMIKTIQDFMSDNWMFSVGLIFGVVIGMMI